MKFKALRKINYVIGSAALAAFLSLSINTGTFAASKKELRRVDNNGSVSIAAVYLTPLGTGDGNQQVFELSLDTHSDDLSRYTLAELVTLKFDGGTEVNASEWKNLGGRGHHISGTVTFDLPDVSTATYIELKVKNVGGVEERKFRWDLPLR